MKTFAVVVILISVAFAAELPKSVRVCKGDPKKPCATYTIVVTKSLPKDDLALTTSENRLIRLRPDSDRFRLASTLFHELMHAVLYENGYGAEPWPQTQHEWIYHSESGLTRLFHDNPGLGKFFEEAY